MTPALSVGTVAEAAKAAAAKADALQERTVTGGPGLDGVLLDGRKFDVLVTNVVIAADEEETMGGASTFTLRLLDPENELLDSGLFDRAVDVEVDGREYRLVKVGKAPPQLTLTFEDLDVARLRGKKGAKKASRGKVTRAQFAKMLVQEVKARRIRFYSPEMNVRQPVAKATEDPEPTSSTGKRGPGFPTGSGVKVKGKAAKRAQLRVLSDVLEQGSSQDATRRVLIGAVMCVTQESTAANLKGGDRDSVGAFQQRGSQGWPATRNVKRDAREFFRRAIPVFKANPGHTIGWCVDEVQRSYTFNTGGQGKDYDKWKEEAEATVDAWLGEGTAAGGGTGGTYTKRYEFSRGQPDQPEDSWTCLGRLADEVKWRRFMRRGTLWFVSEAWLIGRRAKVVLEDATIGVRSISFDADSGKAVQTVQVEMLAAHADVLIGDVVALRGQGPATGRYLVETRRQSRFSPVVQIGLKRRTVPLPEPRSETAQRTERDGDTGGALEGTKVEKAYTRAQRIHNKRYPYVWGGGHGKAGVPTGGTGRDPGVGFDCSGGVSAVLHSAGILGSKTGQTSGWFESWGEPGEGKYLTVYANAEHVFIEFKVKGGKVEHWGSGDWGKGWRGCGFNKRLHPHNGFVARHWPGT